MATTEEKFEAISEDTQKFFDSILTKISSPYQMKYHLVNANRQKQIVKLTKIPEVYGFITGYDAVLTINENLFEMIDNEELQEILVRQEIDKLTVDIESGKIRTIKPDMTTFSGIIKRFGWEQVAKANQLDVLAVEQQQDQITEQFLEAESNNSK